MSKSKLGVDDLTHKDDKRKNIPTAEYESVMRAAEQLPVKVKYPRGLDEEAAQRNPDLDPQLIWRDKDYNDLEATAPPIYIQEKVKPKVLVDDLRRVSERVVGTVDMFGDFNGLPEGADRTEFYQHEGHWQNRMILGDSLQVMASLAEREGLRGKVQCIYFDPPYGIKFNSNFQWSTTSRDVKDGNTGHITREPEQVKAFRDTWRDGIHSYLSYIRDRLTAARDLLTETGSIFVQIGDENVHRVRAVMDEVFGEDNFVSKINVSKTTSATAELLAGVTDYILWFAKNKEAVKAKYRPMLIKKIPGQEGATGYTKLRLQNGLIRPLSEAEKLDLKNIPTDCRIMATGDMTSQRPPGDFPVMVKGKKFFPVKGYWKTGEVGFERLIKADRVADTSGGRLAYIRYLNDFPAFLMNNVWTDTVGQNQFGGDKVYVVQTANKIIERCVLMSTDPGDLVLDPTCGSGTTAYVAEQWGRRWITIDTSRVALALARARIMGARYPFYLLADSREGQQKEAEITHRVPSSQPVHGNIAHGFVYERVPHVTLKSIANNAEIDVIWDTFQQTLEPLRERLNKALGKHWQEWEIPREADTRWSADAMQLHAAWWRARIDRQKEIDASIAARAEVEFLYDKPYEDRKKVRVAGPFTVESLSPHRVLGVDYDGTPIDNVAENRAEHGLDFVSMILANLKTAGVQQAHKADKIEFTALEPWPGEAYVCAVGTYLEGDTPRRAGIFVGPEFGTVSRQDLVAAAREAGDANFDVLVACAFSYDAMSAQFERLGRIPVLKARMNADLHMAEDLKNTGQGNLFVVFGEPDVDILDSQGRVLGREGGKDIFTAPAGEELRVRINGVDVFHPGTGEVRSDGAEGIACWFLDTDYNEESFFVRHAYFLGANDPYKALRTTLKAEIDASAWATLNSDISRSFQKPNKGRIAVKVINHLGDEVMKVFRIN